MNLTQNPVTAVLEVYMQITEKFTDLLIAAEFNSNLDERNLSKQHSHELAFIASLHRLDSSFKFHRVDMPAYPQAAHELCLKVKE